MTHAAQPEGGPAPKRARWWIVVGAVLAALAFVGLWLAGQQGWDWAVDTWTFLGTFVTSAGFGAIAALLAAAVAYRNFRAGQANERAEAGARREHEARLEESRHREAVANQLRGQRWQILMWIQENADAIDPKRLVVICGALESEVDSQFERQLLAAVVERALDRQIADETRR